MWTVEAIIAARHSYLCLEEGLARLQVISILISEKCETFPELEETSEVLQGFQQGGEVGFIDTGTVRGIFVQ